MRNPLNILLIEDDIDDVELLKEALEDNGIQYDMDVIMEGDKVSGYIEASEKSPEIIVMDLNLPKADGKEILQALKTSGAYIEVPIVVLTTSSSKDDIDYCYGMGISQFITKPATIEGWNEAINSILQVASREGKTRE